MRFFQKTVLFGWILFFSLIPMVKAEDGSDILLQAQAAAAAANYKDALYFYNEAVSINPGDAELYKNRGNVYFKMGQYVEALRDY